MTGHQRTLKARSIAAAAAAVAATGAGSAVATLATAPAAGANQTCRDSGNNHFFAGSTTGGNPFTFGAQATISNPDPNGGQLCTTGNPYKFSSVWVMIEAYDYAHGVSEGYVQAGYIRLPGFATPHFYSEYSSDGGNTFTRRSDVPIANKSSFGFKVQYDANAGVERMYTDGSLYASTPWSPVQIFNVPFTEEYLAETHDRGDDMFGTPGSHVSQTNEQVQGPSSWVNPPPGNHAYPFGWRYHDNLTSANSVDIWTDPMS